MKTQGFKYVDAPFLKQVYLNIKSCNLAQFQCISEPADPTHIPSYKQYVYEFSY